MSTWPGIEWKKRLETLLEKGEGGMPSHGEQVTAAGRDSIPLGSLPLPKVDLGPGLTSSPTPKPLSATRDILGL